jgi:hypothetical protein
VDDGGSGLDEKKKEAGSPRITHPRERLLDSGGYDRRRLVAGKTITMTVHNEFTESIYNPSKVFLVYF